ncbi:MAG: oxidoreductase [Methylocystis sp.]|nr:MAG: oxidoreductase [Methylocystis sp.]
MSDRGLAVVTGASSGIGYELARLCAERGYDLVVAADEPEIAAAAQRLRQTGAQVRDIVADLSTTSGVEALHRLARDFSRPVDVLIANAGCSFAGAVLDLEFPKVRRVVDTNVTGTVYLLHLIGRDMRARGAGRIMIVGSVAGYMPGPFNAVYNASKAFINSFAAALRNELSDSRVSVTCLIPGATETEFFRRAGMLETRMGRSEKDPPSKVALDGFEAMMRGDGAIVSGWYNKGLALVAQISPAPFLARVHRWILWPKSAARG